MTRVHVPENHVVHAGALMNVSEVARYVRPGTYAVQGRPGDGPLQDLAMTVSPLGTTELRRPVASPLTRVKALVL